MPAASPLIFTGLRLSLQASWTTLVAAELVGALSGLGRVLNLAQQDIYPGMILVGMRRSRSSAAAYDGNARRAGAPRHSWAQSGGRQNDRLSPPLPVPSRSRSARSGWPVPWLVDRPFGQRSYPASSCRRRPRSARRFVELLGQPFAGGTSSHHMASSVNRFLMGYLLAAAIGVPLGLLMGWFRLLDDIVTPLFDGCASSRRSPGCRSRRCGSAPASAARC